MRIQFIGKGKPSDYLAGKRKERADLTVFGLQLGEEVSYEKELAGETRAFEDIALLSKTEEGIVVCGCVTDAHGHKRNSAVVAERGKLLGVSDMLNVIDGETGSGANLRVYDTKAGKMGVAVADDLRFPEVFQTLGVCGSDFIVCPHRRFEEVYTALLRAHAYCFGVPVFFCAEGYCAVAHPSGELIFSSEKSPCAVEILPRKEYHLVETRRAFIR